MTRLAALPIPAIAALNGPAAGAGVGLALACDLRLASDQATFMAAHTRIGLHLGWGASYFLPRVVGLPKALELSWSTEIVDAAEALRVGLVNRVFASGVFADEVRLFAARLAAAPRNSVRLAKRALVRSAGSSLAQCLVAEIEDQERCWASADSAEGLAAFTDKRPPRFTGGIESPDEPPVAAARHFE